MTKEDFTTIPGYPVTEITKENNPSPKFIKSMNQLMLKSNKGQIFILDEPDVVFLASGVIAIQGPETIEMLINALND